MTKKRTTIIVPCYNEQFRLQADLFSDYLRSSDDVHLLFVDDGSTDETFAILTSLEQRHQNASTLRLPQNVGKAEAVRHGVLHSFDNTAVSADYIGYWDADLATPLTAIQTCRAVLERRNELQVVLGSRFPLLGRDIQRDAKRRAAARAFSLLVHRLTTLRVRDTQCGAKLFRAGHEVRSAFARSFGVNWVFDIEVLLRLQSLWEADWQRRVYECPLDEWHEVGGSKLKPTDFLVAFREVMRLAWAYRGRNQAWLSSPESLPSGNKANLPAAA